MNANNSMQIKHPALYTCQEQDPQCDILNDRLKNRQLAISGEPFINNILLHYIVGYILISTLCSFRYKLMYKFFKSNRLELLWFIVGLFFGWLAADVLSYFLHLLIDSPFWRDHVTKRDRQGYAIVDGHHEFTLNYSTMNNVELVSICYPIFVPVFAILVVVMFMKPVVMQSPMYFGFFIGLVLISLLGGFAHKWAHEQNHGILNNRFIKFLQDIHVLLHPSSHKAHHSVDELLERYNFSLTTGAAEVMLDPILKQCREHEVCKF